MTTLTTICGCVVSCVGDRDHEPLVAYCPLHASAPALLAALEAGVGMMPHGVRRRDEWIANTSVLIRAATGKEVR